MTEAVEYMNTFKRQQQLQVINVTRTLQQTVFMHLLPTLSIYFAWADFLA
jgi:hypothetical protein